VVGNDHVENIRLDIDWLAVEAALQLGFLALD
jgi:hypothetical protein